MIRRLAAEHRNLVLDEDPDYVAALTVADAMMSDLSSLAGDFLVTGRPLLYLHRSDGPGPNAVGDLFSLMERADAWPGVRDWLERVRTGVATSPDPSAVAAALGPRDGRCGARLVDDLVTSLLDAVTPALPDSGPLTVVTVREVGLVDQGTSLSVTVQPEGEQVRLSWQAGLRGSGEVPVVDGRVLLPTYGSWLGAPVLPLPAATYRLRARCDRGPVRLHLDPAVWERHGEALADDAVAVTLAVTADDALSLVVSPPLSRDQDRSRVLEQQVDAGGATQAARARRAAHVLPGHRDGLQPAGASTVRCTPVGHDATRYWLVEDLSVEVPSACGAGGAGEQGALRAAATCRWLVDNEAMPSWSRKRDGQVLLQTWHGTPLKRLRWDLHEVSPRDPAFMAEADRDAGSWDVVLSPNPHSTEVLRRAFRVRGDVLELGYPRNDVLADPVAGAAAGVPRAAAVGDPCGRAGRAARAHVARRGRPPCLRRRFLELRRDLAGRSRCSTRLSCRRPWDGTRSCSTAATGTSPEPPTPRTGSAT